MGQGQASAAAALLIARRLVRIGRREAAARLLESMHALRPDDTALAIARARLLEWQLRRPDVALAVVEAALSAGPPAPARLDLEVRRERLRGKLVGGRGRRRRGEGVGSDRRRRRRQRREPVLLHEAAEGGDHDRVEATVVRLEPVQGPRR